MCDQIGAHTETILGINRYVTHCHKYVAAPRGRGLCTKAEHKLRKGPWKADLCVAPGWKVRHHRGRDAHKRHTKQQGWRGRLHAVEERCTRTPHPHLKKKRFDPCSDSKHGESPLKIIKQHDGVTFYLFICVRVFEIRGAKHRVIVCMCVSKRYDLCARLRVCLLGTSVCVIVCLWVGGGGVLSSSSSCHREAPQNKCKAMTETERLQPSAGVIGN